ncbi:MAG TPA: RluA family pseudouridine synthase [Pirellulaceae bacterium]|nr:RluA family pseudouridine synthase [Pirellulaceae bacterium]
MGENLSPNDVPVELVVADDQSQCRIDSLLAERFPQLSRSRIQSAMRRGLVTVDGRPAKPSQRVTAGQRVTFQLPPADPVGSQPEDIPLDILFEDENLAAINKPAGMVVHPAKGHWRGTLTAALVHHFSQLSQVGGPTRPGVIHRLDRDTSGVILVAKSDLAHSLITRQFAKRTVVKEYLAIVSPGPDRDRDLIELPIGVHPYHRERMAVRSDHATSRPAQTFFEVVERFDGYAWLRLLPKSGRTHQLRVHMAAQRSPIVADRLYGARGELRLSDVIPVSQQATIPLSAIETLQHVLIARQALHAFRLEVDHPVTGNRLKFEAPLPSDFAETLSALRQWRSRNRKNNQPFQP